MALADAILEIAQDMENDAKELVGDAAALGFHLKGYATQLRRTVKAAEGTERVDRIPPITSIDPMALWPSEAVHDHFITAEREKIRAEKKKLQLEDQGGIDGSIMVEVADGPLCEEGIDKTVVQVEAGIQPGQMPLIADCVYRYGDDKKLHYCEKETEAYRKQRELQNG